MNETSSFVDRKKSIIKQPDGQVYNTNASNDISRDRDYRYVFICGIIEWYVRLICQCIFALL